MTYLSKLHILNKTCLIFDKKNIVFESSKRGVQPLIDFLTEDNNIKKEYILIDKIIGRGAVILAKLIGVIEIHTPIISQDALQLSMEYGMKCEYQTVVPYILNREKSGRCPIESCVLDITDPRDGFIRIQKTLENLKKAT